MFSFILWVVLSVTLTLEPRRTDASFISSLTTASTDTPLCIGIRNCKILSFVIVWGSRRGSGILYSRNGSSLLPFTMDTSMAGITRGDGAILAMDRLLDSRFDTAVPWSECEFP